MQSNISELWIANIKVLDIDVKLYSFHFNRQFIDDCIKVVFKNVFNKRFFLKHEFSQIKILF